ncbi:Na(+)-translocating NADH-quinone reductase subunit A [hydrothermal vent metagenome]|uniref:Na(+)-translocating NADH-quinone reductase subunit A n=1 Tax=hydrothermal vent metagenome TaxID=652676 RepID=A0A3B1AZS2_9ZZZZ
MVSVYLSLRVALGLAPCYFLVMIRIKKGLDLPIKGAPEQLLAEKPVTEVAVVASDYIGLKPVMAVEAGEKVSRGQLLFTDKSRLGVRFTAPAGGVVTAINRGERRVLLSVVIKVDDAEEETQFTAYSQAELSELTGEQVRENLLQSGLWIYLRTRPFSKIPAADSTPHAIFITAMDSNPLAADPQVVLREREQDFINGLEVLAKLGSGKLYLCKASGAAIPESPNPRVVTHEFAGPHPTGLVGTHIHFLEPVSENRCVWHLNYQDVVAIGRLFVTGSLPVERVISLAGPQVERPRLVQTRLGANLNELAADELQAGDNRIVSGSVLCGRQVQDFLGYLGPYHLQVSVLGEDYQQELLGWLRLGKEKFSALNLFSSSFSPARKFAFSTSTGGETRPMVPVGSYEAVMPLDILPTQLLRALIIGDREMAQQLGCLELDEEDLALCTFVCPGKYDYGPLLRETLNQIEKEG